MKINNDIIEQARKTDMVTFLEGWYRFEFIRRGSGFRCKQHPSLGIGLDRVSWYWHSRSVGGYGVLDFLIKAENMGFREAVEAVSMLPIESASPVRANLGLLTNPLIKPKSLWISRL